MKLRDICSKIGSGATPKGGKEAYKASGTPLIRSQNVLDWNFTEKGLAFIDDDQAAELDNASVCPGDILLNITGDSVARCCQVPDCYTPARVNQHVAIIRASDSIDATYLLSYLQLNKPALLKLASSGATRNALTKRMIEGLDVLLPSLDRQRAVASFVRSLQRKITLNRRINDHLSDG